MSFAYIISPVLNTWPVTPRVAGYTCLLLRLSYLSKSRIRSSSVHWMPFSFFSYITFIISSSSSS